MTNSIPVPRDTWFATNVSDQTLSITDVPTIPLIKPKERINLLNYATLTQVNTSVVLASYITKGLLITEDYLHTHDDKSDLEYVENKFVETNKTIFNHTDSSKNVHGIANTNNLVSKSGSINQLSDISYRGNLIEEAVDMKHQEKHTILSHDTNATGQQLNILTGGSESCADQLHTHDFMPSGVGHNDLGDLQGGQLDQYYHLNLVDYMELINWLDDVTLIDGGGMTLGGYLGIGVTASYPLHVSGESYLNGNLTVVENLTVSGSLSVVGEISTTANFDVDGENGITGSFTFDNQNPSQNNVIAMEVRGGIITSITREFD